MGIDWVVRYWSENSTTAPLLAITPGLLARKFWESKYGADDYADWPLERRVRAFLTDDNYLIDEGPGKIGIPEIAEECVRSPFRPEGR